MFFFIPGDLRRNVLESGPSPVGVRPLSRSDVDEVLRRRRPATLGRQIVSPPTPQSLYPTEVTKVLN